MESLIDPEFEKFVEEKLQSGRYDGVQEVVAEALKLLRQRDERENENIREALRRAREQSERGEGKPAREVFERFRAIYDIPRDDSPAS